MKRTFLQTYGDSSAIQAKRPTNDDNNNNYSSSHDIILTKTLPVRASEIDIIKIKFKVAVINNDTATLEKVLQSNVNITKQFIEIFNQQGVTPLLQMINRENYQAVELLLKHGASINGFDQYKATTPMHAALRKANFAVVKLLLNYHPNIDIVEKDGISAREMAKLAKPEIQDLVANYDAASKAKIADINNIINNQQVDNDEQMPGSPLFFASHKRIAFSSDESSSDESSSDNENFPRQTAIKSTHSPIKILLTSRNNDSNTPTEETEQTANQYSLSIKPKLTLNSACRQSSKEVILAMLDDSTHLQDINKPSARGGYTPLLAIVSCKNDTDSIIEILEKMVKRGALVDETIKNNTDEQNSTALHIAVKKGHKKMVEFLLNNGANPIMEQIAGDSETTPLAMAKENIEIKEIFDNFLANESTSESITRSTSPAVANTENNTLEAVDKILPIATAVPTEISIEIAKFEKFLINITNRVDQAAKIIKQIENNDSLPDSLIIHSPIRKSLTTLSISKNLTFGTGEIAQDIIKRLMRLDLHDNHVAILKCLVLHPALIDEALAKFNNVKTCFTNDIVEQFTSYMHLVKQQIDTPATILWIDQYHKLKITETKITNLTEDIKNLNEQLANYLLVDQQVATQQKDLVALKNDNKELKTQNINLLARLEAVEATIIESKQQTTEINELKIQNTKLQEFCNSLFDMLKDNTITQQDPGVNIILNHLDNQLMLTGEVEHHEIA